MRVIFAKFPLLRKIQTLSHKPLVRQTSNDHHCNWHAQKPICRDFQIILHCSSWSKTTLCIFKEQICLPNRKCYGKNKLYFDWEEMLKMALTSYPSTDCKTYTLLTSVHNDADDTDNADTTDNADDYSRVVGIALLKAFSCANNR